jgi:hypothetical protein
MKSKRQSVFKTCTQLVRCRNWLKSSFFLVVLHANSGLTNAQQSEMRPVLRQPVINPGFEQLIEKMPLLATGSAFSFVEEDQWLIAATGRAIQVKEDGTRIDEYAALKVAMEKAKRRLAETLEGYKTKGIEKSQVISNEENGVNVIERLLTSMTERTVSAYLKNAETVGHWQTDSGDVVVMVVIGSPSHPLLLRKQQPAAPLVNAQWKDDWEEIFMSRPAILEGGASLVENNGEFFVLAVGRVSLAKVPDDAVKQKRVAENDVLRHASNLINGISFESTVRVESVFREMSTDEQIIASSIKENLASKTWSKSLGGVRIRPEVGQWKSEDDSYAYFAHVFPLSDFITVK